MKMVSTTTGWDTDPNSRVAIVFRGNTIFDLLRRVGYGSIEILDLGVCILLKI